MKSSSAPVPGRSILDARHRLVSSCFFAAVVLFAVPGRIDFANRLVFAWCAFALTDLLLSWTVMFSCDPYQVRRDSRLQDSSATFLFILVISAATASLLAVAYLLNTAKGLSSAALATHIGFAVAAVLISWTLLHTLFALRYAHYYFWDARKVERQKVAGGLEFPGKGSPGYLDFAYFSFVIGMTCQVSDVQISSPQLRRIALLHGLISFLFNTAILAAFVNIIAGLV